MNSKYQRFFAHVRSGYVTVVHHGVMMVDVLVGTGANVSIKHLLTADEISHLGNRIQQRVKAARHA
ncbi:hypothetical protein [Ralstonia phage RP13]|nr:hypothetical protein [Ralstonia phage RP13]